MIKRSKHLEQRQQQQQQQQKSLYNENKNEQIGEMMNHCGNYLIPNGRSSQEQQQQQQQQPPNEAMNQQYLRTPIILAKIKMTATRHPKVDLSFEDFGEDSINIEMSSSSHYPYENLSNSSIANFPKSSLAFPTIDAMEKMWNEFSTKRQCSYRVYGRTYECSKGTSFKHTTGDAFYYENQGEDLQGHQIIDQLKRRRCCM